MDLKRIAPAYCCRSSLARHVYNGIFIKVKKTPLDLCVTSGADMCDNVANALKLCTLLEEKQAEVKNVDSGLTLLRLRCFNMKRARQLSLRDVTNNSDKA